MRSIRFNDFNGLRQLVFLFFVSSVLWGCASKSSDKAYYENFAKTGLSTLYIGVVGPGKRANPPMQFYLNGVYLFHIKHLILKERYYFKWQRISKNSWQTHISQCKNPSSAEIASSLTWCIILFKFISYNVILSIWILFFAFQHSSFHRNELNEK